MCSYGIGFSVELISGCFLTIFMVIQFSNSTTRVYAFPQIDGFDIFLGEITSYNHGHRNLFRDLNHHISVRRPFMDVKLNAPDDSERDQLCRGFLVWVRT